MRELRRVARQDAHVYLCCDADTYPVFFRIGYPLWPQSQLVVWYKPTGRRGRGWLHSFELVLHLRTPQTEYTDGFRQDVIGIMPVRTLNRQHPAEKPGDLWSFLAEGIPPNGRGSVLDPFMGGGSALRWAKDRGMKAVGIEIEEHWCEVAAKRMAQGVLDFGTANAHLQRLRTRQGEQYVARRCWGLMSVPVQSPVSRQERSLPVLLAVLDFLICRVKVGNLKDRVLEVLGVLRALPGEKCLQFLVAAMSGVGITDPPLPDAIVSRGAADVELTGARVSNPVNAFDARQRRFP
jgi:hypothetical protein